MARTLTPDALRHALSAHGHVEVPALPGRSNHIRAGVLVPVSFGGDLEVILTQRAANLRQHAGEVCFPGGRPEEQDLSLEATALREAKEEIALSGAEVLGRLSSIPVYTSDHRLEPFVSTLGTAPLRPAPGEVARILKLNVEQTLRLPHLDSIPWEEGHMKHLSPVFHIEDALVFGATAYVLYELLGLIAPLLDLHLPKSVAGSLRWQDVLHFRGRS
ncbi:MAG: CoA pyrophosphatase [Deltaproteobacteria bacterium]|nr:CoA pyrophosphatase [Deltaproteobacteria bacterium]